MARAELNQTTGDLDVLRRLVAAQRDLHEIAADLFNGKGTKRAQREDYGRRLNGIAASLRTVTIRVGGES